MKEAFRRHEKNGLIYYTVPSFEDTGIVTHAFSGRKGGVSTGSFDSLNMSILTADHLDSVLENRKRLCGVIGINPESLIGAKQIHRDNIYLVKKADQGAGAKIPDTAIADTDAMMTNEHGLPLILLFADCVPVFFMDPVKKVVALAHAGWKGTVVKIAAKTVEAMQKSFGSNPADILAAIGPSIGPCHYQVDKPVIDEFKKAFPDYWQELLTSFDNEGYAQLNLWQANVKQLCEVGIKNENITVANLCTYCCDDLFFSHRRGMAGRQAAIIMMK